MSANTIDQTNITAVIQRASQQTDNEVGQRPHVHPDHHAVSGRMMFISELVLSSASHSIKRQRHHLHIDDYTVRKDASLLCELTCRIGSYLPSN